MATVFAWFREETYVRLYEISTDKDRLPKTFKEWRLRAEVQIDALRKRGISVTKVEVDPDALIAWANGATINSNKRAEFAAFVFTHHEERRH